MMYMMLASKIHACIDFIISLMYNFKNTEERFLHMALKIKDGRVVSISPPKLSKKQMQKLEDATVNKELIKQATSRKYNIVSI